MSVQPDEGAIRQHRGTGANVSWLPRDSRDDFRRPVPLGDQPYSLRSATSGSVAILKTLTTDASHSA
jgi:hypothetical protein